MRISKLQVEYTDLFLLIYKANPVKYFLPYRYAPVTGLLSSGNSKYDINTKFKLYEETGVPQHCIVIPQANLVNVFDLDTTQQK